MGQQDPILIPALTLTLLLLIRASVALKIYIYDLPQWKNLTEHGDITWVACILWDSGTECSIGHEQAWVRQLWFRPTFVFFILPATKFIVS